MKRSLAESDFVGRFYFRHIRRPLSFVGLIGAVIGRAEADEPKSPAHRLIVGWDDAVIVCGPGTVAGMDSPRAIAQMVKRWKGRGHQGIYWRADEAMLPERFMTRWKPKVSPGVNYLLERLDQKLHEFPVLKTLLAAAEREQLEVWAWYPTIYSNGALPTGPGFTQAWLYENKFGTDHPEVLSVDRAGNKHFMVWEYAYPEARKAKFSEFVQIPGDRAGTSLGNWHLDWRTWIDEGLVNELVVSVVLDGYEDYGSTAKATAAGYIDGAVSVETVRQFGKQSRHPTVRVIQAGGPASTFHTPPPHADGWRSPWYAHYAIGRDGIRAELAPPAEQMLKSGDVTPWCNVTPTVYQDSGAALNLSVRHSYHEKAARFKAKLEFGRASVAFCSAKGRAFAERKTPDDDVEVIKTFDVRATPNGLVIIAPPDLESPQNIARLKRDRDFAEEVGKMADAFEWPKHGRKPVKIPFLVSASISGYPAGIRDRLLRPVRLANLTLSLTCDTPLVDAVELRCEQGLLLALSNHTLQPLDRVELRLKTDKPVMQVESVRLGPIPFERLDGGSIRIALPLEASDFVTLSTQANAPAEGALRIGKQRVGKVLFLGNSITLHGPAPKIGWTGNWGMAASAEDKDYVHLLTSQIAKAAGGKPEVKVKNIADFERRLTDYKLADELKEELAFEADVVIIALGENASSPKTDEAKAQFATAFANLFAELKKHGQPRLFVRSQFWQDADKDRLMQKTCEAAGGTFIDISKLGFEETNYARAERKIEHAGVAGHPGDKGMKALADALWNAIQKQAAAE